MRSWDWNDVVKHAECVQRGHELVRKSENAPNGAARYQCKCGATAEVTNLTIKLSNGEPISRQEKAAKRAERKAKYLGTQGT